MRGIFLAAVMTGFGLAWHPADAGTLLVLPVVGDSSQTDLIKTASHLYQSVLESQYTGHVQLAGDSLVCGERVCAFNALSKSGADQVIYSQLHRLGTKWIFSSTLLSSNGAEPFNQRLTAMSMEDMEGVSRRMADALLNGRNVEQAASLDNITQKENTEEPRRRRSFFSSGGSLGYLWPVGNSFSYRVPTDTINRYRLKTRSEILHFSWISSWELRNNLLLVGEIATEPTDKTPIIGGDLDINYLHGDGDISPFAGGGLGLHYVTPDEDGSTKRNSGPTLNAEAGLMLFRTYDFHVLLRGRYRLILNSDLDNGFVTDVGVTYKTKAVKEQTDNEVHNEMKIAGYSIIAILLLGLLVTASN